MFLKDLAQISKGSLLGESLNISDFSIDSRSIKKGQLYVALKGVNFDGHDFVEEALKKGASAVVISKDLEGDFPRIVVKDTKEFINSIAAHNREEFKGKVIGITGTNGKTSSKQILSNLLNENNCHRTEGNKNNQIGVPFSLLSLNNKYNYSVIEMGTSEKGEIDILKDMVKPDIAAITNVSEGHLEGLKDTISIAKEKGCIFNFNSDQGIAFLPRDSEFYDYWLDITNAKEKLSFGIHKKSDFRINEITTNLDDVKTSFMLNFYNQQEKFEINGLARHNAYNAALSIAIAIQCNVSIDYIKENLCHTDLPDRRLSVFKSLNGSLLIDDTYNANIESTLAAIDYLKAFSGNENKIFIFGDMLELGDHSEKQHRKIGEKCNEAKLYAVLTIGNETIATNDEINQSTIHKHFDDKNDLISYFNEICNENDKILVKGSRGMHMEEIVNSILG